MNFIHVLTNIHYTWIPQYIGQQIHLIKVNLRSAFVGQYTEYMKMHIQHGYLFAPTSAQFTICVKVLKFFLSEDTRSKLKNS